MPHPNTIGGGLMGYPSSVDTGGVAPVIISNDAVIFGSVLTDTFTINVPFLYAFKLDAQTFVTGMRWRCGTTAAGHTNMAIYTLAGNIVAGSDTGSVSNVASNPVNATYGTAVSLAPGQYYLALASDNGTDTYLGTGLGSNQSELSSMRQGTNTLAAGAMPLTLGSIAFASKQPGMAALTSGGLA